MTDKDFKKNITNKRILLNVIDLFLFSPLFFPLFPIIIGKLTNIQIFNSFFLLPSLFIIYFGFIPVLTNGYSLGGLIIKMQILTLKNNKLSILDYLRRILVGWQSIMKSWVSGERIMNGIGQYDYDIKYDTTILPDSTSPEMLDKKIIYRYDFLFDIFLVYLSYSFGILLFIGILIFIVDN